MKKQELTKTISFGANYGLATLAINFEHVTQFDGSLALFWPALKQTHFR